MMRLDENLFEAIDIVDEFAPYSIIAHQINLNTNRYNKTRVAKRDTLESAEELAKIVAERISDVQARNYVSIVDNDGEVVDTISGPYNSDINPNIDDLIESFSMSKDEYLRDAAKVSWESGHPYDPDDFSYFKKVCKEDGYTVTEEDFQKYWDYFEECRPMMNIIQRDNQSFGPWKEIESKQVKDSDDFMTDYTWYVKDNADGSETHIMIFGDKDVYHPLNSEPDAEFDGEEVAREWFDNYKGFEDEEEVIDEDVVINESSWAENSYAWGKARQPKIDAIFEAGLWEDFEDAVLEASAIVVGLHTDIYHIENNEARTEPPYITDADIKEAKKIIFKLCDEYYEKAIAEDKIEDEIYNGYVVRKSDTSDNYFVYDNNGHVEDDEHKGQGYLTKEEAIERANSLEKGIAKANSDLEEAIKPNIESEELKALAQKHNIKILDAMSNGDLRMEGAGADLMKFYQEAEQLGLWQVNPELYEALHGKEEIDEFFTLAKKLGFHTMYQMNHIMKAAHDLGYSELDFLKSVDKTFNGKIPDSLIDGITDEFLVIAEEIGLETQEDYEHFCKEEVEPGETITQAIKRYRDEINDLELDESVLFESSVDKDKVLDYIANAKAYISENKFPQAQDALIAASKLLDVPMNEGAMSNLDLEIKEAGGQESWKDLASKELAEMKDSLHYLRTYAPKEIGAGGNYDSAKELQDDIDALEKDIDELQTKLDYINSIKRIG